MSNQITLANKREQWLRAGLATLVMAVFYSIALASGVLPALAATGALDGLMNTVVGIVTDAAKYIGIVIIIWGVFQIVLAFRREDSEGISKQITTVVVGGVLIGFDVIADQLVGLI